MNDSPQKPVQQYASQDITEEFLKKYVPIELFVATKNIPEEKVLEMIREGTCVGYTKNNQWFVGRSELDDFKGSIALNDDKPKTANAHSPEKSSNSFLRLIRGDLGLEITFWVAGVFTGIVSIFLLIGIIQLIDEDLIIWIYSIWVAYFIAVTIGVLRSCKHFKGSTIWAVLAIITSLGFILLSTIIWFYVFSLVINGYASN